MIRSLLTAHTKQNGRHLKEDGEPIFTIKQNNEQAVMIDDRIRRLMEVEAEELQGFPTDWTKYGLFSNEIIKEISPTNRYKCIGNAVTVDVVESVTSSYLTMRAA